MRVCVLQPDYSTSGVDYQHYDPPRNLSALLPEHQVDHVFLNKLTTYKQLKELSTRGYDIFVNLCEGYLEWEVPSIEVIYFIEMLGLPFTGPSSVLYDPPKELMKYVAYVAGVPTANAVIVNNILNADALAEKIGYPVFIKPAKAGDSLGIDENALAKNKDGLIDQLNKTLPVFKEMMIEKYIDGREFTVLLAADPDEPSGVRVFNPVEYIFPEEKKFKTYALKTSELHPDANIPVKDESIVSKLKAAASSIFKGFEAVGYARMDFRMEKDEIYFLEVNFTCSVFYENGYEGSADHILMTDGYGQRGFLELIMREGISRHAASRKKYYLHGNSVSGYGIYAGANISRGEIVFRGEEKAQRVVSKDHVMKNWEDDKIRLFSEYAYPVGKDVFILWDRNPSEWAPQNHSCNANTEYIGLDVVAMRDIKKDEELTLDYARFLGEDMKPFECSCGSNNCRGLIRGLL
jgi:D-alanine-D-alanine ligase-like ATP-grasp enzyme